MSLGLDLAWDDRFLASNVIVSSPGCILDHSSKLLDCGRLNSGQRLHLSISALSKEAGNYRYGVRLRDLTRNDDRGISLSSPLLTFEQTILPRPVPPAATAGS